MSNNFLARARAWGHIIIGGLVVLAVLAGIVTNVIWEIYKFLRRR